MGDVAQGIKAFKKGMSEEDKAEVEKTEAAKTIEHQPENRFLGSQTAGRGGKQD
jgi:Sec-independent protein translocase protein TatA